QAARIAELELALAKAKKNSATSSKPPSSDLTNPPPKHHRSGRRAKPRHGGQPGHTRHLRVALPPERVDETQDYEIQDADIERLHLTPTGTCEIIHHIELPETPVRVTEHRLAGYRTPTGALYFPDVPELKGPLFGPRLLSMIGWLKSVGHLSYSAIEAWMADVLQVPVSRGYLAKLCTGPIAEALAAPYAELTAAIPHQAQLGSDETSLKDNGKKRWIWCITATTFSVFHIAATRSREVLEKLIGPEFAGYLNFDYFSANCSFAWNFWIKAQYCWAHLIRDIRFLATHPDPQTTQWAERLLERARRLFAAWHRRDKMSALGLARSMRFHRDQFLQVVRQPPSTPEAQTLAARFALVSYTTPESTVPELYDRSQDYFRFMFTPGVEPTNNHSEQQIRHCVIDRRITQGTRGVAGQRYHERMWTAIATCKKQQRNFFSFLHEALKAQADNRPAPSLLRS
ncbi:MAG: IS66 family transposase, partial [Deltaproteobacteria bacterium]|nr:IS66 family transposase [Deltaproteobacteria bacterium]